MMEIFVIFTQGSGVKVMGNLPELSWGLFLVYHWSVLLKKNPDEFQLIYALCCEGGCTLRSKC